MSNALETTKAKPTVAVPVNWSDEGVKIQSLEEAYRFAQYAVASGFLPEAMRKPEAVIIALQAGMELGLTPWQSIQSIVPIKGTPTVRTETARALVEANGLLEPGTKFRYRYEGEGDQLRCIVWTTPRGAREPVESDFSMADAKTAGLAGKDNWKSYPKRMLLARATGFHVRDYYPTAIRRMPFAEEHVEIEGRRGRPPAEVVPPSARRVSGALAAKLQPAPEPEKAATEKLEPEERPEGEAGCDHPEGFSADDTGGRVCILCGQAEEPTQGELLPPDGSA